MYQKIPSNWYIVASDVKKSTQAIKEGKYKEVNMLGALTIISILNLRKEIELPFVFGGDGAFLLIPSTLLKETQQALLAIQKIASDSYSLELRIGIIPMNHLYLNNKEILISKFKITKYYSQAIIKGGGLSYCDYLLKSTNKFHVTQDIDSNFKVDIDGLECRWNNITSPKDETISLLIQAKEDSDYENILQNLEIILGTKQQRNPITKHNTTLTFKSELLEKEVSIYTQNKIFKFLLILKLKFINLLGKLLMKFQIGDWQNYLNRIISATDTEKFDDMLRMVVSSNIEQTKQLEEYLDKEYKAKKLNYGLHKADSSLLTCLIFERHGKHIHFVDSSNGGYAMAAINMKAQLSR